jgi:hypothetical protein
MGVSGHTDRRDHWSIDPEALLVLTLRAARREPRLFDEVLGLDAAKPRFGECSTSEEPRARRRDSAVGVGGPVLGFYPRYEGHSKETGAMRLWSRATMSCQEFEYRPLASLLPRPTLAL